VIRARSRRRHQLRAGTGRTDLRTLNRIDADPDQRIARVEGGARWGAIDAATQEHGLAVTGGRVSDTGIGGLALGSGRVGGQPFVGVIVLYVGDPAEGEEAFRPLREFGPPGLDMVQQMPYVAATKPISPFSQVIVMPGGGAIARVPEDASASVQRNAEWNLHYLSIWEDPAMLDKHRVERVAAATTRTSRPRADPDRSALLGHPDGHVDGAAIGEPLAGGPRPHQACKAHLADPVLGRVTDEPRRHRPAACFG
jgi:FAD binding domain